MYKFMFKIRTLDSGNAWFEVYQDAPTRTEAILLLLRKYPEMIGWQFISSTPL